MALNKKGQWIFVGIMVFIMVIIVAIQFISPLKDQITDARGASNLDCDNSSISTAQKMTCVVTDTTLFYFIGVCIAGAGAYLMVRKIQYKYTPPQQ